MSTVSLSPIERARKNEQVVLQALAATGQSTVALGMGVNESTVSRMKDGAISQATALLAHCGLKVVPVGVQCFNPEYVEALKTLAELGIRQQAPKLDWGDVQ
jgi:S-methylmethionine-dependent homocysteine/selenocysteine methylase